MGYVVLDDPHRFHPALRFLFIAVVLALFVLPCLVCLLQMQSSEPLIVLRDEGIIDQTALVGSGLIDWNDIEKIFVGQKLSGKKIQYFLCIQPASVAPFMEKQSPLTKVVMQTNLLMLGAPIAIRLGVLPISAEQLNQIIVGFSKGRLTLS